MDFIAVNPLYCYTGNIRIRKFITTKTYGRVGIATAAQKAQMPFVTMRTKAPT